MATARSAPGPGTSQAFSADSPPPGGDPGYENQPPWADDDYDLVLHDQTLSDPTPGVLWNDYDPENDPLTAQLVSGPQNGSVTLNPGGSFLYEPNPGFAGQDSSTCQATDGISYVDLYPWQDGKQPTVPGKARLKDDDHLTEEQDIPMPDTSQLEPALADAFIVPLINGDNDNLLFSVFTSLDANSPDYYQTKMEWDTKNANTPEHWTIYLFGAFEDDQKNDNDPDSEAPLSGYTDGKNGGSIIWIETAHDFAREEQVNPNMFEQDTVVHEVTHALARIPNEDNPKTPANEGPTNYPDVPSRFSDHYIDAIRASKFPVGASQ